MNSIQTLTTEAEISAYVHRTRMQLLTALRDGPATSTMMARQLDVHPANLTRHIRTLKEAGLITLVEKRDTGRNLEKWYAASARTYEVAPDAEGLKAPHKIGIAFARSDLSEALARLPDEEPEDVCTWVVETSVDAAQVAAFQAELKTLAEKFQSATSDKDARPFHLVLAMYPGDESNEPRTPEHIRLKRTPGRKRKQTK